MENIKAKKELYRKQYELLTLVKHKVSGEKQLRSVSRIALNNVFMSDYFEELKKLPELEREVLLRWFDEEGYPSMTAQEIGEELNITPDKVLRLKENALVRLKSSKKLQSYNKD